MQHRLTLMLAAMACSACPQRPETPATDGASSARDVKPSIDVVVVEDIASEHDAGDDAERPHADLVVETSDASGGTSGDTSGDISGDAPGDTPGRQPCSDGGGGLRVRIAAANLTSGNQQTYEPPGVRILQALRPDVVMIQEFRYGAGTLRMLVDTAFGPSFQYFVEEPAGTGIPNGIVSRYPILESGEWDDPRSTDRDFVWARIDLPGTVDLWAFSVHLLRSSPEVRASEASDLLTRIGLRVPAGDYVVVGGDLNSNVETESVLSTFGASLRVGPPYPVDQLGNNRTSGNRSRPYDWVLARRELSSLEVPLRVGAWCYAHGLVFDSRIFTPLSDLAPVLAEDSAAVNMQHMLVARDYLLPEP